MKSATSITRWLLPLALAYAGLMRFRAKGFAGHWLRSWRPPVPTISVGNISWGGSGKTPLCEWLIRWCQGRNLRPLLLTRGYKAAPPRYPYRVQADSPARCAGDEPLMLYRSTGADILVDPKRTRSGTWGWTQLRPDLFILDDGFQHLTLERDLDLVLMRPRDLEADWNRVIPAGPWREGPSALDRASAFVLNASPEAFQDLLPLISTRLGHLDRPIFSFCLRATGCLRVSDRFRNSTLPDSGYLLVSGVGNPQAVEQTATRFVGRAPLRHLVFPDHHPYSARDWDRIVEAAGSLGSVPILCTPKDSVKLEGYPSLNLWTLDLELVLGPTCHTRRSLPEWLEDRLL